MWDSEIERDLEAAHNKAIDIFGDQVIATEGWFGVDIGPYKIKMIRRAVPDYNLFNEPKYQIEVEIAVCTSYSTRWFVGIYYKKIDNEWILVKNSKNSYEITRYVKGIKDGD